MQPMPVHTYIPGRSLPRQPSTGRLVVPASAGDPDPTVRCFPCGPYDPQYSMLSVGQELRMNWPASNDFRPNAFNATGVITNVDIGNMSAPYTMRVNGEHVPVALDPYSGRLMTKGGLQGGFLPQMKQVEDRSAKQAAGQVLSELKQDGALSDPYKHISLMAAKVAEICDKENALLELDVAADETCAIFGDVHGNFRCLKNLLGYRPSGKTKFLFLGDFVDRGSQQLEVVAYLFAKKVLFPEHWFLVRGNHEDMALNQRYGFEEECTRRVPNHGAELYQKVNQVFQYLPMAAIVTATQQKGIFCCHGGIGPDMTGRDAIRQCYKPCCGAGNMASQPWERILRDLTWSDVRDPGALTGGKQFDANGWLLNPGRGPGVLFWGPVATERFLRHMDCRLIVRAHDPAHAPSSLKQDHDGKVLTIFSSTPYPVNQDNDGFAVSNEGAVMLKLIGATGEITYSKINQYHQLDNRIDEQGITVRCDPNFQGMPLYQDGFYMPKFTQLSREASSSPDGPETLFAWRRGLHVVFGNTKREDGETNLREVPDGPPMAQMLEDGEVVLVQSLSDDKEWVRIKSKKAGNGWTRAMYLHQQLLDLSIDDLHVLPGLHGQFVMKPGKEVIVGADHHEHPGMCTVWATPGCGTPQSVPNGSKAFITEVDQTGQWVRIECREVPGWTLSKHLHVQAQFTDCPQVRPFLPLQHKYAVFGSCRKGKPYPLIRDGKTTDEILNDGEVVLIVKENGLSNLSVEVQSRRQDGRPKWGWVHMADLHLQRRDIGLPDGMMLPHARPGMCALEPGQKVMVGITHKQAQQCGLRRAAGSQEGIGIMVQDGEMVEVISLSENDEWVQVKKIDGSCGWLLTMSVHVQLT